MVLSQLKVFLVRSVKWATRSEYLGVNPEKKTPLPNNDLACFVVVGIGILPRASFLSGDTWYDLCRHTYPKKFTSLKPSQDLGIFSLTFLSMHLSKIISNFLYASWKSSANISILSKMTIAQSENSENISLTTSCKTPVAGAIPSGMKLGANWPQGVWIESLSLVSSANGIWWNALVK